MSLFVEYNKTNKQVSFDASKKDQLPEGISYKDLNEQIVQLNDLTQQLISFEGGDVPLSTEPSKKITQLVKSSHESGVKALKAAKFEEAIKHFTIGIDAALRRNKWESFQLNLFETHLCLMNRADAYLLAGRFPEAYQDADLLIKTMNVNPDNFYRRSIALLELGLLEESKADLERGLAFQPGNVKLQKQLDVMIAKIDEENGDV